MRDVFGYLIVFASLVLYGILFFEWGRAAMRREILADWRKAACRECGAMPRPFIIHVSGCESGWPNTDIPQQLKLPGEE